MQEAFICDGIRTPIGRYGGGLASIRTDDLAAIPINALMDRHPACDWAAVDDIAFGCANQAGEDNRNVARMAALLAGMPASVPATTVNRLCGSGMDAVGIAARAIRSGETSLWIAGGVESMSRAPFVMPKAESAFARANAIHDTTIGWRFVNPQMKERFGVDSMPETAENVAEKFGITRADQDAFALCSQQRAAKAAADGFFAGEIAPVTVIGKRGKETVVREDEHPRPDTTADMLAKLRAPFRKNGTVTAGNASGVNDGACALILATEASAAKHGLAPIARVVGMATAGTEPRIMGIGPIAATQKVLAQTGLSLSDMACIELNEAFASQALAVLRGLDLADNAKQVNPNGGGIALGHPLGMSGARLVMTTARQLQRTKGRYGLATMCIGVGQGIAMVLERV